jgi:hypothetical protein
VPRHELTRTQKNAVTLAIREAALDVADFEWRDEWSDATKVGPGGAPYNVEVLVHLPTEYAFAFDIDANRGHHYATFKPGPEGPTFRCNAGAWEFELAYVHQWLANVQREYEAPDLWAEVLRERELAGAPPGPNVDNSPFTPEEQQLVSNQLAEMRELILQSFELQAEQINALDERVAYLGEATARLGKFDWRGLLTGQLVTLVLTAVIPQHAFAVIGPFISRTIGHLFGGGGPPELPGGPDLLV